MLASLRHLIVYYKFSSRTELSSVSVAISLSFKVFPLPILLQEMSFPRAFCSTAVLILPDKLGFDNNSLKY